jgi:hypothetical protein
MQIIVHVNGFHEWVPVPADVPRDAKFDRALLKGTVKTMMNGEHAMKVPKSLDTHVAIGVAEDDIIQCILQEMTRGDRAHLTRVQAVTRLISRHVLPHQCHASHVEEFEIGSDDGPDLALFDKIMSEHVECGNIDEIDLAPLREAYSAPAALDEHHDHLHAHFRLQPERVQKFRAKRYAKEAAHRQVMEHFHAHRAKSLESNPAAAKEEVST